MCLTIIMFCAGFTIFSPLCFPFKTLMISLLWPFFLQLHFMLITALLRLSYYLFFRDISLKSQELSVLSSSYFNELFCLIFFVKISLFAILLFHGFIRLFIRLFIRILFVYLFVYFFIVASPFHYSSLILSSCLAVLIYLLFRIHCFLLNCANSVLCAV